MGCLSSKPQEEAIRKAVRRISSIAAADLEPLALNDPMARRAVMDFVEADFNCSGALTADEFSRRFGLDSDLFLGRVVGAMDGSNNGSIDLPGMSQFNSNSKSDREKRITRFAFSTMDVAGQGFIDKENLKRFAMQAYEQFTDSNARKQPDEDDWGDVKGRRTRAVRDMQHCCRLIDERCGVRVAFEEFQNLSESIPLLLAPAALTWSTFEHLGPACHALCAAMQSRGHANFGLQKQSRGRAGRAERSPERRVKAPSGPRHTDGGAVPRYAAEEAVLEDAPPDRRPHASAPAPSFPSTQRAHPQSSRASDDTAASRDYGRYSLDGAADAWQSQPRASAHPPPHARREPEWPRERDPHASRKVAPYGAGADTEHERLARGMAEAHEQHLRRPAGMSRLAAAGSYPSEGGSYRSEEGAYRRPQPGYGGSDTGAYGGGEVYSTPRTYY